MSKMVETLQTDSSALSLLLGESNAEEIKRKIGDLIVDRVADDINAYGEYLFYPEDYESTLRRISRYRKDNHPNLEFKIFLHSFKKCDVIYCRRRAGYNDL